jgi:hypothetical protein
MIEEIEDLIITCLAKNLGKGVVKPYDIQVANT